MKSDGWSYVVQFILRNELVKSTSGFALTATHY